MFKAHRLRIFFFFLRIQIALIHLLGIYKVYDEAKTKRGTEMEVNISGYYLLVYLGGLVIWICSLIMKSKWCTWFWKKHTKNSAYYHIYISLFSKTIELYSSNSIITAYLQHTFKNGNFGWPWSLKLTTLSSNGGYIFEFQLKTNFLSLD